MDAVVLSRIQFALTVGFHFVFPPLTIGLAWIIVYFMAKYKRTGSDFYRNASRFWIKLFTISFAVGVASGITMEFQFGTNWAAYSRFVGDIFGSPLAAEAIFSFFLESVFVGVLLFGWNRLSRNWLWFASLMVAFGSTLSAFWILVANSWMQTPAGFHIVGGRAELTSFWEALFNPSTIPRVLHTVCGALMTGSLFMLGISAWYVLKNRHTEFARISLKVALMFAVVSSIAQLGFGHAHGMQVAATQPEKLAAIEGLFDTQSQAPALVFGIPSREKGRVHSDISIHGLLSLLAFGNINAEVKGLNDFPKDDWPPLWLTFFPFHLMVGIGMFLILFTIYGIYLLRRKKIFENHLFLNLAIIAIPLPILANELGWMTTEIGRQPWIVYHVMRTSDAISFSVPAGQILATIILFCAIYLLLTILWIYILTREISHGPEDHAEPAGKEVAA
jgi:cytochrome d ubiquinol oxidase subunit I